MSEHLLKISVPSKNIKLLCLLTAEEAATFERNQASLLHIELTAVSTDGPQCPMCGRIMASRGVKNICDSCGHSIDRT